MTRPSFRRSAFALAAWACCSLGSFSAATHLDFHPGETLDFLRLDGHGENNRHLVVTWLKGLSVIDASSLAVADLDTGRFVGPITATDASFFYYDHDVGAAESSIKSLSRELQIEVIGSRISGENAAMGTRLLFSTRAPGQEILASDGTPQGTYQLMDPVPGWLPDCGILCDPAYNMPNQLHGTKEGKIFFVVEDGSSLSPHQSLWTRDAPALFPGLPPAPEPASRVVFDGGADESFLTAEGRLVFTAWTGAAQRAGLYSSDGSAGDLRQLALFSAGFQSDFDLSTQMAEAAGVVYFRLETDGGLRQLWRTDGKTAAGTYLLHDFGASPPLTELVAVDGKVYFGASSPAEGRELWVSDGTVAGTRLLVDARPGPAGGDPYEFRALTDRRFVFSYDDGIHGREPFISDGTAAGTRLLEDVRPGPASSDPRTYVPAPAAGRLFFVANDPAGRPSPSYLKLEMPLACAALKRCGAR